MRRTLQLDVETPNTYCRIPNRLEADNVSRMQGEYLSWIEIEKTTALGNLQYELLRGGQGKSHEDPGH